MKLLNILMVAVLSIPINSVFAQKTTPGFEQSHSTKSKKELMKMEVIKVQSTPKNYSKNEIKNEQTIALSLKEQMKISVIKKTPASSYYDIANNNFRKCTSCVRLSNFSLKEQMKMEVMGIHTKANDSTTLNGAINKCLHCGVDLPQIK